MGDLRSRSVSGGVFEEGGCEEGETDSHLGELVLEFAVLGHEEVFERFASLSVCLVGIGVWHGERSRRHVGIFLFYIIDVHARELDKLVKAPDGVSRARTKV